MNNTLWWECPSYEGYFSPDQDEDSLYYEYESGVNDAVADEQEGLIYLFSQWLDLVKPADFGQGEEGAGVLV